MNLLFIIFKHQYIKGYYARIHYTPEYYVRFLAFSIHFS